MNLRPPFRWPENKKRVLRRATRLEFLTLALMTTVVVVMYLAMGSSQTMKVAWIEDMLGLVPALAFLVARHFESKPPDQSFPFGRYKAVSLAHLLAASALIFVALFLIYDSSRTLIERDHPTIGSLDILGHEVWMGWVMIAALVYSMAIPAVLGRLKKPLAHELHDPVLLADASMQAADWKTGGAGVIGILGVGFGFWWFDAAAALLISVDVFIDGRKHMIGALRKLSDGSPRTLDLKMDDPAVEDLRRAMERIDWVEKAELEMRTEGRLLTGAVLLTLRDGRTMGPDEIDEAETTAQNAHWRVYYPTIAQRL